MMIKALRARLQQKHRTIAFPAAEVEMPDRFRGRPLVDFSKCPSSCGRCEDVCPTGAMGCDDGGRFLDMGLCVFCGACADACPSRAIEFSRDYAISANRRADLVVRDRAERLAGPVEPRLLRLFSRSFKIREVSAGGCNACEADINVLSTVGFDLGRFGIQVVASPRHADALLVTGPVTRNMSLALEKTYEAVPSPKLVIACGACAISGGVYGGHAETHDGVDSALHVDLYIPGCPPHPMTILDGLLRLIGRLEGHPPRRS